MRDVAERAGVAVSSVSRVLSGHPDVTEVMRNRVRDAAFALGYEPDLLAQSMRTGNSRTVGFVVGDVSNSRMAPIVMGAEVALAKAGYAMLLADSVNDVDQDVRNIQLLQQRRVDGLLVSISDESDEGLRKSMAAMRVPAVLVDREIKGVEASAILSDHGVGVRAAVAHLLQLGHRRLALLNGNPNVRPSRVRASAVRNESRKVAGVKVLIRTSWFTHNPGYDATIELLTDSEPPTALIVGSNQVLVGVLRAIRELALAIPGDVSLVSCDEEPMMEFLDPPIAAITRDLEEMGRIAATLIVERVNGASPRTVTNPTVFRPAASCGPVPATQTPPRRAADGNSARSLAKASATVSRRRPSKQQ